MRYAIGTVIVLALPCLAFTAGIFAYGGRWRDVKAFWTGDW